MGGARGRRHRTYRLQKLIGLGEKGEVYRAYDTRTDPIVALKLLPAHLADDTMFQQRFRRESQAAAGLNEPHVVPIHGFGEIDGRLYLDMRLIEGRNLGPSSQNGQPAGVGSAGSGRRAAAATPSGIPSMTTSSEGGAGGAGVTACNTASATPRARRGSAGAPGRPMTWLQPMGPAACLAVHCRFAAFRTT